jgi:hypothetical protein
MARKATMVKPQISVRLAPALLERLNRYIPEFDITEIAKILVQLSLRDFMAGFAPSLLRIFSINAQ